MKNLLPFLALLLGQSAYCQKQYKYPLAPKDSVSNQYFEYTIEDPYHWMEDPNDPRLEEWLKE